MPRKPRKMQQHREACRTLNQRADRRAAKTKDEVSLPVARHSAIGRFGGAVTIMISGETKLLPRLRTVRLRRRPPTDAYLKALMSA
ncbi:Integrase catalytic protein [Mesorhizobium loti]|nr:Integrase catalytic protein [Mesorhizobium loti]